MAGALQDLGRAVIVGTTTFGKGSVQSIIPGRQSHRHPPDHRSLFHAQSTAPFTKKGVVPDIMAPLTFDEEARLMDFLRKAPSADTDPVRLRNSVTAKLSTPSPH